MSTIMVTITGMHCGGCATRIEKRLNQNEGVSATVNFALGSAALEFAQPELLPQLLQQIEALGYQPQTERFLFEVRGLRCASCAKRLESHLLKQFGIVSASVNSALAKAEVVTVANTITPARLRDWVSEAGFSAEFPAVNLIRVDLEKRIEQEKNEQKQEVKLLIGSALCSLPLFLGMFYLSLIPSWVQWLLATPVQFYVGARFYRGAWLALKQRTATMDTLVALGTSAAYFYSLYLWLFAHQHHLYFEGSALVITFVALGKWLEERARISTTQALRSLMDLRAKKARVWRDGAWSDQEISSLLRGDRLLCAVGERIPADGRILMGSSEIDESIVTGESLPILRNVGDRVLEGTLNGSGQLEIEVLATGEDSNLGRVIRLVERAQMSKAPIQRLVDKISARFVPAVLLLALITLFGWIFIVGDLSQGVIAAVSVLVVACPCALGLATPAAIVVGTGVAAKRGILIRDVEALQKAHQIKTVVFDKTGTLTEGKPQLLDWLGSRETLRLAAALQQGSNHPLGIALQRAYLEPLPTANAVEIYPGMGVVGLVEGKSVRIGNSALLQQFGLEAPKQQVTSGQSIVYVAVDGRVEAVAIFQDLLRAKSKKAIADLRRSGISCWLLSGDNESAVAAIAEEAEVDGYFAAVLPEGKVEKVEQLRQARQGIVAMVGDGVNDAPALAAADVGIAMGSGTEVAMESSAITLMSNNPQRVVEAISLSKATWRTLQRNLFWAFAFNVIALPLAALGMLSPALAGGLMALSSLTVLANSLWLKSWRFQER